MGWFLDWQEGGGMEGDVWINKTTTLELAELADGHSLLGFHYLGTCHLALPLMGLLM